MLKSLRLQNFQSHTDSTFHFDAHFNCIIGGGNDGKTSVCRSIELLMYDTWDKSWVTYGQPFCTLTATMMDGTELTRIKGQGVNEYNVVYGQSVKKPAKYSNFSKTGIPEEILKIWKIQPITLPGLDLKLNVSSQLDPAFSKLVSRPNRAKLLGKLSSLDVLDVINQDLSADKRRLNASIKTKEEDSLLADTQLLELAKATQYRPQVDDLRETLEVVQQQSGQLNALEDLANRIHNWKTRYSVVAKARAKLQKVGPIDTDQIGEDIRKLTQVTTLGNRIASHQNELTLTQEALTTIDDKLVETRQKYVEQLNQSGVCPTCFTPITDKCLQEVLTTL